MKDLNFPVEVTASAQVHFLELIRQENLPDLNIRIEVLHPRTAQAQVNISFCSAGEEESTDLKLSCSEFELFITAASRDALEGAVIDYKTDETELSGHLAITAPQLKGGAWDPDAPLRERIEFVLNHDVRPNLAAHGGNVTLMDLIEEAPHAWAVILKFSGGCHGCGMAAQTLKQGIEKTLKDCFPEVAAVRDTTDHSTGTQPYYV